MYMLGVPFNDESTVPLTDGVPLTGVDCTHHKEIA